MEKIEEKINIFINKIKKRKYPYVDFTSPSFFSSDCYNWDRIEIDLLELIKQYLAKLNYGNNL